MVQNKTCTRDQLAMNVRIRRFAERPHLPELPERGHAAVRDERGVHLTNEALDNALDETLPGSLHGVMATAREQVNQHS